MLYVTEPQTLENLSKTKLIHLGKKSEIEKLTPEDRERKLMIDNCIQVVYEMSSCCFEFVRYLAKQDLLPNVIDYRNSTKKHYPVDLLRKIMGMNSLITKEIRKVSQSRKAHLMIDDYELLMRDMDVRTQTMGSVNYCLILSNLII